MNTETNSNAPAVGQQRLVRLFVDRPWREYPEGTKARAVTGGAWYKRKRGWKWNGPDGNGGTFPTPGGDACGKCIELPEPNAEGLPSAGGDRPKTEKGN